MPVSGAASARRSRERAFRERGIGAVDHLDQHSARFGVERGGRDPRGVPMRFQSRLHRLCEPAERGDALARIVLAARHDDQSREPHLRAVWLVAECDTPSRSASAVSDCGPSSISARITGRLARAEIETVVAIRLLERAIEMVDQAAQRGAETGGGVGRRHSRALALYSRPGKMYKPLCLRL